MLFCLLNLSALPDFSSWAGLLLTTYLYFVRSKKQPLMKGPKIELTPYQRFIEGSMHLFIIVVLLGILLKVLVF